MTEFILEDAHAPEFRALDEFTRGYIEALFFTEQDSLDAPQFAEGGFQLGDKGFYDLAPETRARIVKDCADFQDRAPKELTESGSDYEWEAIVAGRDFWFTRCGHGVGFWDGGWDEPHATTLTELAKTFGNIDLYVGDDGKIYA